MRKNNIAVNMRNKLIKKSQDFRVQIFNTLGLLGFALGIVFGTFSIFINTSELNIIFNYGAAVVAAIVILLANRTGKYKFYFLFTVVVVFLLIFPVLFFMGGGLTSGMPSFFVFAVVFTIIMLEGGRRAIFTVLEIMLYAACFLTAYFHPEIIVPFATEADMAIDIIVGSLASSVVLAIAIYQHITVYDRKQNELEKANAALHGLDRMKTEFLQEIKHEVKNPLYVISLGTDFVNQCIAMGNMSDEARNALNAIQNEAMRLGRMVNGMVEMATMSGSAASREKIDFAAVLNHSAETARLQTEQKCNTLRVEIAPDLPYVYGSAEQLGRVPVNLLSNANDATQNGEITLEASAGDTYITVRVSDTGEGIDPGLLPRVFERGVSGKGGKGYGLYICKNIIDAHGGAIEIKSGPGKGTSVVFTVPVYGGQGETGKHE